MKRAKDLVNLAIQVAALLALAIGMVVLFRAVSGNGGLGPLVQDISPSPIEVTSELAYPPPGDDSTSSTAIAPELAYPPPEETSPPQEVTPPPTVEYIELTPGEFWPPTDTPLPTFTPYPTPTLRPGPTDTPIPLVGPAKDAAGTIIYFSRNADSVFSFDAIEMNPEGEKISPPSPIYSEIEISEFTMLPSPDGSRFMIVDNWGTGNIFNADTGKVEILPQNFGYQTEQFFNWFPDNHKILIRANLGSLWLADLITGEYRILAVPGYGSVDGAAASPDGMMIIYSLRGGISEPSIWIVNADGREEKLLVKLSLEASYFSWSPDGKQVAFLSDGWMIMNADGSNMHPLGHFGIPACFKPPSWSPDSRWLAIEISTSFGSFCQAWNEEAIKSANILIVDVESGESHHILLDGNSGNLDPAWSPDGKQIAFVSNRSGTTEIWAVNVDGSNLRQLTNAGQFIRFLHWSKR